MHQYADDSTLQKTFGLFNKKSKRNFRSNTTNSQATMFTADSSSPYPNTAPLTQKDFELDQLLKQSSRRTIESRGAQRTHEHERYDARSPGTPKTPTSFEGSQTPTSKAGPLPLPSRMRKRFEPRGEVFEGIGRQAPQDVRPHKKYPVHVESDEHGFHRAHAVMPALPPSHVAEIDDSLWKEAMGWVGQKVAEDEKQEVREAQEAALRDPTEEEVDAQEEAEKMRRIQVGKQYLKRTSTLGLSIKWDEYGDLPRELADATYEALHYCRKHGLSPDDDHEQVHKLRDYTERAQKWMKNKTTPRLKQKAEEEDDSPPSAGFARPAKPRSKTKQKHVPELRPRPRPGPLTPEEHRLLQREKWDQGNALRLNLGTPRMSQTAKQEISTPSSGLVSSPSSASVSSPSSGLSKLPLARTKGNQIRSQQRGKSTPEQRHVRNDQQEGRNCGLGLSTSTPRMQQTAQQASTPSSAFSRLPQPHARGNRARQPQQGVSTPEQRQDANQKQESRRNPGLSIAIPRMKQASEQDYSPLLGAFPLPQKQHLRAKPGYMPPSSPPPTRPLPMPPRQQSRGVQVSSPPVAAPSMPPEQHSRGQQVKAQHPSPSTTQEYYKMEAGTQSRSNASQWDPATPRIWQAAEREHTSSSSGLGQLPKIRSNGNQVVEPLPEAKTPEERELQDERHRHRSLALGLLEGSTGDPASPPSTTNASPAAGLGISTGPESQQVTAAPNVSATSDIDVAKLNEYRRQRRMEDHSSGSSLESLVENDPAHRHVDQKSDRKSELSKYEGTDSPQLELELPEDATDPYGDDEGYEMDPTPSKPAVQQSRRATNTNTTVKRNTVFRQIISQEVQKAQRELASTNLKHPAFRDGAKEMSLSPSSPWPEPLPPSLQQQSRVGDVAQADHKQNLTRADTHSASAHTRDISLAPGNEGVHAQDFSYGGVRVNNQDSDLVQRPSSPHPTQEVPSLERSDSYYYTSDRVLARNMAPRGDTQPADHGTPTKPSRRNPTAVDSVLTSRAPTASNASSSGETLRDDAQQPTGLENRLNDAINLWQQDSAQQQSSQRQLSSSAAPAALALPAIGPVSTAAPGTIYARVPEDVNGLRLEFNMPLLKNKRPLDPPHPNHEYAWESNKLMCFGTHTSHPDDADDVSAHSASFRFESTSDHNTKNCMRCGCPCCFFADRIMASKIISMDSVLEDIAVKAKDQVVVLRRHYPQGIEDYETMMSCTKCDRIVCPKCSTICNDPECTLPLCKDCVEEDDQCPLHEESEPDLF